MLFRGWIDLWSGNVVVNHRPPIIATKKTLRSKTMPGADANEDMRTYSVVINEEEQYSIWLADRDVPTGWRPVGNTGSKTECLEYIDKVWTDMRPLSLRKWMDEIAASSERTPKTDGL
jgi:MbtH protein